MKIYVEKSYEEKSLCNFDFCEGAEDNAVFLTCDELYQVGEILEDLYPNGMDETEINNLFEFEAGTIAKWLGYNDFEELKKRDEEEK